MPKIKLYNKRSIIPNIFTMGNMVIGFIAIIFAARGDSASLAVAGILIFAASFFDLLDGAIARALKVQSGIGVQLDSLADAISYGIAPGIISYQAYLNRLPNIGFGMNIGMILATIYPICAVYRLARFNITEDRSGFKGLPSPAAGIFISSFPALQQLNITSSFSLRMDVSDEVFLAIYIIIGLLMVTQFDYSKLFSDIAKKGIVAATITIAAIALAIFFLKMWAVFLVTGIYILSGLMVCMYNSAFSKKRAKRLKKKS